MHQPAFTYDQWLEIIKTVDIEEFAAYEEMLRQDCMLLMGQIGMSKISDLTGAMRDRLSAINSK